MTKESWNGKRYSDLDDQEKRDYHNQKKREFRARQRARRDDYRY